GHADACTPADGTKAGGQLRGGTWLQGSRAELERGPALAIIVRICIAGADAGKTAERGSGDNGQVGDGKRHAVFDECRDDDGNATPGDDVRSMDERNDSGHNCRNGGEHKCKRGRRATYLR